MKTRAQKSRQLSRWLVTLILSLFVLTGCQKLTGKVIRCPADQTGYQTALTRLLPDYTIDKTNSADFVDSLKAGQIVCAYDVQAGPAIDNKTASYWYPQYLATVVIAVDRQQTAAVISSWSDLTDLTETVSFPDDRLTLAALSYGLEGADYTGEQAISFLKQLAAAGRLVNNDFSQPVFVCLDYQAVALNQQGRNLQIVVPAQGTLTFTGGLLSNHSLLLNANADELIIASGLRPAGTKTSSLYPSENYQTAVTVTDYTHFNAVTQRNGQIWRHQIMHTDVLQSADQIQHQLFVAFFIVIIIVWSGLASNRILSLALKKDLLAAVGLIAGWLLLRYAKWQLADNDLSRYCWYGYYFFQFALPLLLLRIALRLDGAPSRTGFFKWLPRFFEACYIILFALVMTNDFHHLVFVMDNSRHGYSYNTGYYIIYAVCIVNLMSAIGIMFYKASRSFKPHAIVYPLSFCGLLLAYSICYTFNFFDVASSDYVYTVSVFSFLFLETAMRAGLIPINNNYYKLFAVSPLKMQIVSPDGTVFLHSEQTEALSRSRWQKVKKNIGTPLIVDKETMLLSEPISGGYIIWQKDIAEISRLAGRIENNVIRLQKANAILARIKDERQQAMTISQQQALAKLIRQQIAEALEQFEEMREQLDSCPDRQLQMGRIALLLCYIKRRCSLVFLQLNDQRMPVEDLTSYLKELNEFACYIGIQITADGPVNDTMLISQAIAIYEFCYRLLDILSASSSSHLIISLQPAGEDMELMVLLPVVSKAVMRRINAIKHDLKKQGGSMTVKVLDDAVGLTLTFSKEDLDQ